MDARFIPRMDISGPLEGVVRLDDLGAISASGPDAAAFLHNQLTQDIKQLASGQSVLAALCNARGRMVASFVVLRSGTEDFVLVCHADLLATALKQLSRFVLREKVALSDASANLQLQGIVGPVPAPMPGLLGIATLPPAGETGRALWIASADASGPSGLHVISTAHWQRLGVQSGAAMIQAASSELFVPQMLNYESVGAVNFDKGCYPGQEVVARLQFRGQARQRAYVGVVAGKAQVGQDVFEPDRQAAPCGVIAQVAATTDGSTLVIASIKCAAVESEATLHVGSLDGPALSALHLPYALRQI